MKKIKLSEALKLKDVISRNIDSAYKAASKSLKSKDTVKFKESVLKIEDLTLQLVSLKEQVAKLNQSRPLLKVILSLGTYKSNNYYIYMLSELKKKRDYQYGWHSDDPNGSHLDEYNKIEAKINKFENKLAEFNDSNYIKI